MTTSLWDQSVVPASNTTVQSVNVAENCPPSGINDAIRALVAQAKGALLSVTAAGTDTYTATLAPAPDALTDGMTVNIRFTNANTSTTPTLNLNSLGAKTITKYGGSALAAGDIPAAHDGQLRYVSGTTTWQLLNPKGTTVAVNSIADATNGGLNFSAATGTVTAKIQPSDLATKSSPTTSDSVVIMDAAASNVAKTSTVAQLFAAYTSVAQIVNTETGAVATGTTSYTQNDSIPTNTNGDQYMSLAITPTNSSSTLIIDVIFIGTVNSAGVLWVGLFQDATSAALASALTDITTSGNYRIITLRHKMTAGTTSSTTFKARAGLNGAATTTFNGLAGSRQLGGSLASSITITEYLP